MKFFKMCVYAVLFVMVLLLFTACTKQEPDISAGDVSVSEQIAQNQTELLDVVAHVPETAEAEVKNVSEPPATATDESETTADSSTEEITEAPIIIDGQEIYDEKDFILSWSGMNLKIISYKAARAYLRGDKEELQSYMLDPENAYYPEENDYDSLDYMSLIGVCFNSETEVCFIYATAFENYDSDFYINIFLIKQDNEWKVEHIGNDA
jgi:hypothetical protein